MIDPAQERQRLFARRLDLVGRASALTAESQRLNQKFAGAQMESMRIEMEIGRANGNPQLVRDLHDAEAASAAIEAERTACEERIVMLEAEIDNIDRDIAAGDAN